MSQRRKQHILQQLSNIQTEASSLARRATQLEHETSKIIQELQEIEFSTHHGYLSGDKVEVTNDYKGEQGLQGFVYDTSPRFVHFVETDSKEKHCREPQNVRKINSFSPSKLKSTEDSRTPDPVISQLSADIYNFKFC